MSTRRRKPEPISAELARGFTVVLEDLNAKFGVFGEQLGSLREQVTKLDAHVRNLDDRFTKLDDRLTNLDNRFTRLGDRFTNLDNRFTNLEDRFTRLDAKVTSGFARVDRDIGLLQSAVVDISRELKNKPNRDEVVLRADFDALVDEAVARQGRR